MADTIIDFSKGTKKIGLIVRGKLGPDHHPDTMAQHADAVLQNGAPVGFFGEANGNRFNSIGMDMNGIVYDYSLLKRHREWYVDKNSAVAHRVVSTALVVDVTTQQAADFEAAWTKMAGSPGGFDILGSNCSTHASAAFIAAGIVSKDIPGLDTPDNLYDQLVVALPAGRRQSYTGFVGFTPKAAGGYDMVIQPYIASPAVAQPNPGSSLNSSVPNSSTSSR
jgi:hypothetical protein